jgi:dienelactone hydrolase
VAAGVVAALAGLAGCTSTTAPPSNPVYIEVSPQAALLDATPTIVVSGLAPNTVVTIQAAAIDCNDTSYESQATFTADRQGYIDLRAAAPSSGSYTGTHDTGLFWSMAPASNRNAYEFCVPRGGYSVTLAVRRRGTVVAQKTFMRIWPGAGVTVHDERPKTVGFYGEYAAPAPGGAARPAVVVFGGSDGGLYTTVEAALLAAHGYPALALAYFREPGLPQTLQRIPLEYFARALTWLASQPGVDPDHVVVEGTSRGSEAALLLGEHYPELVHAVIARVTNDVVLCGITPDFRCAGAAWTIDGAALPYTQQFDTPLPSDVPGAVIAAERIRGPILLNCGGLDAVWTSCPFARAIQERLNSMNFAYPHQLVEYPDAGHGAGLNEAPSVPIFYAQGGGTMQATALAISDFWPRELAFLESL